MEPFELLIVVFEEEQAKQAVSETVFTGEEKEITEFSVRYVSAEQYLFSHQEAIKAAQAETVTAPFVGMQEKYPDRSGYYLYEAKVSLQAGKTYQLHIEDLSESAEVFLNGESLGMKLQKPFRFILPGECIRNENTIRIEVATLVERELYARGVSLNGMTPIRPLSSTGIVGNVIIQAEV
jgi:hypothetical protein